MVVFNYYVFLLTNPRCLPSADEHHHASVVVIVAKEMSNVLYIREVNGNRYNLKSSKYK